MFSLLFILIQCINFIRILAYTSYIVYNLGTLGVKIKILVITNISVFQFYEYIIYQRYIDKYFEKRF